MPPRNGERKVAIKELASRERIKMIGFARRKWASLYSEVPDGFKRLAVVVSALTGIDLLMVLSFNDIFEDGPFLLKTLLASVGAALAWFLSVVVGWLWSTSKLPRTIHWGARWGSLLIILGTIGHLIMNYKGLRRTVFGYVGCGFGFSGLIVLILLFFVTVVDWVQAGGFSHPRSDRAKGRARPKAENSLNHHYAVLGVSPADSIDEIKMAYREKIKHIILIRLLA